MILDFKEIPQANSSEGFQDTFELFTRDFLELLGYRILMEPCRGSDGKKDLIVEEQRTGVGGSSYIKWLVSCKHYAFSKKSVSDTDEPDISDRVKHHKCDGFIGFYSTIVSTSLLSKLEGMKDRISYIIFDREKIEKSLLNTSDGKHLAERYFPASIQKYLRNNPSPLKLFKRSIAILCENCQKNLIDGEGGIWVGLGKKTETESEKIIVDKGYFSCKGECDFTLRNKYRRRGFYDNGWIDIDRFKHPLGFINEVADFFNRTEYYELSPEAKEQMRRLWLNTYPFVVREFTDTEKHSSSFFELDESQTEE